MRIKVKVKPNSKHREEVVLQHDGILVIYTKSPAIDNKANISAIRLLANYFGVSKSQVELIQGNKSKIKIFEIEM